VLQPEQIFDQLPFAVIAITESGQIAASNLRAQELFELSANRLMNKALHEVWLNCKQVIPNDLEPSQIVVDSPCELHFSAGRRIQCLATFVPVGEQDMLIILRHSHNDQQLIEQQFLSQQLIRSLAHEIKNPLGGIQGAAQLLALENPSPETKQYTDVICREVERLKNMLDRMTTKSSALSIAACNIHELTEKIRQVMQLNTSQNIKIVTDYDPSLPDIETAQDLVYQVILNIVKNAIEASEANSQVTIKTRAAFHTTIGRRHHKFAIKVTVIDQGAGIPQDLQQQIFFPTFSTKSTGSGLGLSIAQSIMISLGGLIEFDSFPGMTQFDILIPMAYQSNSLNQPNSLNHSSPLINN
jgi:two-component system, NtrC family, nitrogen regulation sensor histidine kinase GlnL